MHFDHGLKGVKLFAQVRWADIEEKSEQQRLREVGFVVGNTDWSRLVDGDSHASAALNRTKFI